MLPLCTVRTCHEPLRREPQRYVCANNHAFDIARSGYANLLQPNERRSKTPGDSADVVAARRRLYERFTFPLPPLRATTVLDAGCGDGYWIAQVDAPERHGIDISVPAIDAAARRYRDCHFFVANADRFVPYADASFDVVMSITARLNWAEFRRVLRDDGRLLVVVAAEDDLRELRGGAQQSSELQSSDDFELLESHRVSRVVHLDRDAIRDVMLSSYRSLRAIDVDECDVTFSRDLLLFAPARRGSR